MHMRNFLSVFFRILTDFLSSMLYICIFTLSLLMHVKVLPVQALMVHFSMDTSTSSKLLQETSSCTTTAILDLAVRDHMSLNAWTPVAGPITLQFAMGTNLIIEDLTFYTVNLIKFQERSNINLLICTWRFFRLLLSSPFDFLPFIFID